MEAVLGAAGAGVGDAGTQLAAAYDAAWLSYVDSWEANRQFTGRDAARQIADHVEGIFGLVPPVRRALYDAFAGAACGPDPACCAQGMGMRAVRLTAVFDDDVVIDAYDALLELE